MDGKQYFFKENEVREGRVSLSYDGHEYKYQVMETRNCDLVVEEIHRGSLLVSWNLHYCMEAEGTWNLNRDLLAHILMCRNAPPHLERLFPSRSDPEITIAIHAGRIPEAYHPTILPGLCRGGKRASLIWGTKFTPLILKCATYVTERWGIEIEDAIQIVKVQVLVLVPVVVEKYQEDAFDINRLAGYFKTSLERACENYAEQVSETAFLSREIEIDKDLIFEGRIDDAKAWLDIQPNSLDAEVLGLIEHPSTVITEILLAEGHNINYKQIQRIRKELRETIMGAGLKLAPTFAEMVAEGKRKMWPKRYGKAIDVDYPEDAVSEVVWLVRDGVKLEENEKK
jgi:hypothetical protein